MLTVVDPIRKAAMSVTEVTVMETPACFMAKPILIGTVMCSVSILCKD